MKKIILILILLIFGIVFLVGCSGNGVIPPPPNDNITRFVGMWFNVDENTNNIPRVCITEKGDNLAIEVWGACEPEDCYWGEELVDSTDALDGVLNVVWVFSFAEHTQELAIFDDDNLKVTDYVHYTNINLDTERISYFKK